MIRLNGETLLLGGFHDHWARADCENPSLLLAALNYYHYDFVTLQDGPQLAPSIQPAAAAFSDRIRIYNGREEIFRWGHVVTVGPQVATRPLDGDPINVLSQLKKICDLVFLAHPSYPGTWEQIFQTGKMDQLMDDGVIDGINLINATGFADTRHQELMRWYRDRQAVGKRTPIVGGWDVHQIAPVHELPLVLYGAQRSPRGHLDSCGHNRTILFAAKNSLAAISEAVRADRTVIEDLKTGELLGPPPLVKFLQGNGYARAIAQLDARRDSVTLCSPARWFIGSQASASVNEGGSLRLPQTFDKGQYVIVEANEPTELFRMPALLQRDTVYLPVSWHGVDGTERIWAVDCSHPVQIDVLPWLDKGAPAVELLPKVPFCGTFQLEVEGVLKPLRGRMKERTLVPLNAHALGTSPLHYSFAATSDSGVTRTKTGVLTFAEARRFDEDWAAIPKISVDAEVFVPKVSSGANRPYPGPDVYSAQLQFAWTEREFLFRATVRDTIHYQPYHGHYLYNGDCLQLALDPMLRRRDTFGNIYVFNLALAEGGPELYRWMSPLEEKTTEFTPPPYDVMLDSHYIEITQNEGGLTYLLKLPWSELSPVRPSVGTRMGVYYIMFNNNGSRHLDTLHWPAPIDGVWLIPNRWGVLNLTK